MIELLSALTPGAIIAFSVLIMFCAFFIYAAWELWKQYCDYKMMDDPEKARQYNKDNGIVTIEDLESARRVYGSWARVWKSIRSDNPPMTPEARSRLWACVMDEVVE